MSQVLTLYRIRKAAEGVVDPLPGLVPDDKWDSVVKKIHTLVASLEERRVFYVKEKFQCWGKVDIHAAPNLREDPFLEQTLRDAGIPWLRVPFY